MKTPKISVVLELTKAEAQTLSDIVGLHILGCSRKSRRKHTDAVYEALRSIGMNCSTKGDVVRERDYPGMLYFNDAEGK